MTTHTGPYSVRHTYGFVQTHGPNHLIVDASYSQLRDWARRPGSSWPCSELARLGHGVEVTLDRRNGDLIDFWGDPDGLVPADELTAWVDTVLAETPFAALARTQED